MVAVIDKAIVTTHPSQKLATSVTNLHKVLKCFIKRGLRGRGIQCCGALPLQPGDPCHLQNQSRISIL